jgi:hypothetical protein
MSTFEMKLDRDSYLEFIKQQREDISTHREEKFSLSAQLNRVLERFNGDEIKPINWDALNSFPLDEWIILNEKVQIRKNYTGDNLMTFDTIMVSGGNFGWHSHSDCLEECYVVSGVLKDVETKVKYKEGETAIFDLVVSHTPVDLEYCILTVKFKK